MTKEKSFKDKLKEIKDNDKIKDKDKAILDLITDTVEGKKDEEVINFFKEDVDKKYLDKFIGKPLTKLKIIDEKYARQVEPVYFWVLGYLREHLGAKKVEKLVDTYSSSEAAAFHRNMGQALAGSQDRVASHLRQIAQLLQHLFQIVSEITKITERLSLYYDGKKTGTEKKGKQNFAEMTLKDRYISFVEGGTKNPGSVLGLAQQVGFINLDHFFYHTHIFDSDKLQDEMSKIKSGEGLNKKFIEVLGRKLRAYIGWRETSQKQLETRRKWMLSFVKQHYNSIMLNVKWVKPYLRSVQRMTMSEEFKDSPDIVTALEQVMMEIELFAFVKEDKKYNQIVNPIIRFRTSPESEYSQKYQAPTSKFSGRVELEIQSWVLSDAQVLAYKAKIQKEDFELLGYDQAVREATESLGKELRIYLEQADKDINSKEAVEEAIKELRKGDEKKKKDKKSYEPDFSSSIADPFLQVFKGFKEIGDAFGIVPSLKKSDKTSKYKAGKDEEDAKEGVLKAQNKLYGTFKRSHDMLAF
jgi:hypothetical protein